MQQLLHAAVCVHKVLHMDTPLDKMLTSAEACEQLHIDRSTLSRWVSSGRLEPAHKFPGKTGSYLFTREALAKAVKG